MQSRGVQRKADGMGHGKEMDKAAVRGTGVTGCVGEVGRKCSARLMGVDHRKINDQADGRGAGATGCRGGATDARLLG